MLQDSLLLEKRYKRFIKIVCESEIVYALKKSNGFATSSSNEFEDENGNPVGIICFWGEKSRATSCIEKEWSSYKVHEISLPDFLENWCIGMHFDQHIVGTNFDWNMFGFEIAPLELAVELIEKIKAKGIKVEFKKYDDIEDFEQRVRSNI